MFVALFLTLFLPFGVEIELVGRVSDRTYLLREQNLSVYLQPDADTFIADLNHDHLGLTSELVTIFVISHVQNRERRRNIRTTWAKGLNPKPVFLVGLSADENVNLMARDEAKIYQDLIIENVFEDYKNLTLKTMFALKQFIRLSPEAKYFMKIDDDVFLNTFNLEPLLRKYRDCRGIIGSKEPIRVPQRDKESKWHVPVWMYPEDKFPHFVNGPSYIITGSIVESIYRKALETPLITLEDVFITGIVGHYALDYPLFDSPSFRDYPFLHMDKECYFR